MTAAPAISPEPIASTEIPVRIVEESARACLTWLPADSLERLARLTTPSAIRARRLAERDELIRRLALEHYSTLPSGREIARRVRRDLTLYVAAGRLRSPVPSDPRRAALHCVLVASAGHLPSAPTIRRALAGVGGSNSAPHLSQDSASTTGIG